MDQRCHECYRAVPCRASPAGLPTCPDCWPGLRAYDHLGYCYCGDCALRLAVIVEGEGVLRYPVADDACDKCGANGGRVLR